MMRKVTGHEDEMETDITTTLSIDDESSHKGIGIKGEKPEKEEVEELQ